MTLMVSLRMIIRHANAHEPWTSFITIGCLFSFISFHFVFQGLSGIYGSVRSLKFISVLKSASTLSFVLVAIVGFTYCRIDDWFYIEN